MTDFLCYNVAQDSIARGNNPATDQPSLFTVNMDSNEFVAIRKKLEKTQKELATLLGISLKAVCSYEQSWRTIPFYVERQLLFLLSRKCGQRHGHSNCWEIRNCPDIKRERCPAWEFDSGNFCWFIGGTICENIVCKSWEEKMSVCKKCVVMSSIANR